MGKNRITEEETKKAPAKAASKTAAEGAPTAEQQRTSEKTEKGASQTASSKKRVDSAVLYVQSTYNNTKVLLADTKGNALCWSSSGSLGFKGAKKGTPFAAAKIGEVIGDKAKILGVREIDVVVNGVGSGRESSIRSILARGIALRSIRDVTPVPHNGPKPKKPRRV